MCVLDGEFEVGKVGVLEVVELDLYAFFFVEFTEGLYLHFEGLFLRVVSAHGLVEEALSGGACHS